MPGLYTLPTLPVVAAVGRVVRGRVGQAAPEAVVGRVVRGRVGQAAPEAAVGRVVRGRVGQAAPELQDDDAGCRWRPTKSNCRKHRTRIEREAGAERFAVLGKVVSVAVRVGDEQHHDREAAITTLQGEAPLERLKVEQAHFGLDPKGDPLEDALRIPGASVACYRNGNLKTPWGPGR
jgi:hypothetical protein